MAAIERGVANGASLRFGERLLSHGAAKLRLFAGLTLGICAPYFTLQRVQLFPPFTPPELGLDAAVSFAPEWIWAYASLFALVPLSASLSAERSEVAAFGRALLWLCIPSFLFFLIAPSAGPRPPEAGAARELGWLLAVDTPWNAFPSLHAGLTVLCLLHARRVFAAGLASAPRALWDFGSLGWGAAIAFGALASKQHWAIDLAAGAALGALAHHLSVRPGLRAIK